jgi:hypothetical protein
MNIAVTFSWIWEKGTQKWTAVKRNCHVIYFQRPHKHLLFALFTLMRCDGSLPAWLIKHFVHTGAIPL